MVKKRPLTFGDLCSDRSLLHLITHLQTKRQATIVLASPALLQARPYSPQVTTMRFKGPVLFSFPHFIFLFISFWGPNIKKKQLYLQGTLESGHTGKGSGET